MTLKDLKNLIDMFSEDELELPLKIVSYLGIVDVDLYKTNYLGHESIVIKVTE